MRMRMQVQVQGELIHILLDACLLLLGLFLVFLCQYICRETNPLWTTHWMLWIRSPPTLMPSRSVGNHG